MKVECVDSLDGFRRLRPRWEAVYAADPRADVFVSWPFLDSWFAIGPEHLVILVAHDPDLGEVGFLPLAERSQNLRGIELATDLYMAGKPFGPLTGFVIDPGCEEAVLSAVGHYVRNQLCWNSLHLDEVIDPRIDSFLEPFDAPGFEIEHQRPLSCPCLDLAESWEEYLQTSMSKKGRFNLRRSLRQLEALEGYRATEPEPGTIETEIDMLLTLWEKRWGRAPEADLDQYRHMYGAAYRDGRLFMRTLWTGDKPIASLAAFSDPIRKSVAYYTSGFDEEFARFSPGKAIVGHCIRDAINEGYKTFDFLVGGHDYKIDFFGAQERFASRLTILRSGAGARIRRFLLSAGRRLRRS